VRTRVAAASLGSSRLGWRTLIAVCRDDRKPSSVLAINLVAKRRHGASIAVARGIDVSRDPL
jgi:hypothetical protein